MFKAISLAEIERVSVDRFLLRFENSSQILIGNLHDHGPVVGEHINSGNFYAIFDGEELVAVFCQTRRGNLIAQSTRDVAELVLDTCSSPIKGFIGDWETFAPIIALYKNRNPSFVASYESREILYSYVLVPSDPLLQHDVNVRLLRAEDFDQWVEHAVAYMREVGIPDDLSLEQKRLGFETNAGARRWWGYFRDGILVSRASVNSASSDVSQVGGVFTPPQYRKQGLSKATMFHMLRDCRDLHGHRKSVLFTGETDLPAQALYESMGYQRVGSYALVLS